VQNFFANFFANTLHAGLDSIQLTNERTRENELDTRELDTRETINCQCRGCMEEEKKNRGVGGVF